MFEILDYKKWTKILIFVLDKSTLKNGSNNKPTNFVGDFKTMTICYLSPI